MGEKIDKGKIKIRKYGQEHKFEKNALLLRRGEPIIGAGFEITAAEDIRDCCGNIVYREGELAAHSLKTDEKGIAETEELAYGKYNIYETNAGEGYKIHEKHIIQVELREKEVFVNVDSDLILGTLKVRNSSPDTMSFSIFNSKRELILTSIVEEGCTIGFDEMLPAGIYYYKDIYKNMTGFKIENDTDFVLLDFGKNNVEVRVLPKKQYENEFALYKVDDSGKPLMGAVFGLIDIRGTKICFSCSDKDGRVLFKHLKQGTYLVREVEAPAGYAQSEMNVVFSIDDDWINQSERIDRGEKFEDVYIVVSDEQYTEHDNVFSTKDTCGKEAEITCAAEEITNVAGVIFRAEIR